MTIGRWMQENHVVHVGTSSHIADFSDFFNGSPASDIVNMDKYDRATFLIIRGTGGVGTATITVESCDDTDPTTATEILFDYRVCTTPDTWGEVQKVSVAATGIVAVAGADKMWMIEVNGSMLSGTDKYVRVNFTEVAGTAVDGTIICILSNARYEKGIPLGALT